jgi:histidyl-tRNA synthetase
MAKDKTSKLKARLPRGLADRGEGELAATRAMMETIRQVYELYGFEALETPFIEYTDALGKFLPDQDRPNEGVFSFQDDDEQWLSLRYDLTAPLARPCGGEFRPAGQTLPHLSGRLGVPQREARPGPVPPVHAVRCRHGRRALGRGRCRDLHDGRGHAGGRSASPAATMWSRSTTARCSTA